MRCACIDIGSNTTRLLVAEPDGPRLRELAVERVFTAIGAAAASDGTIPAAKIAELADVVAAQAASARRHGATLIRTVATAAVRRAPNRAEVAEVLARAAGVELEVLAEEQEALLAFAGAICWLSEPPRGPVAVIDVGGGSTEVVVGTHAEGPSWWVSLPAGSSSLTRECVRADPPSPSCLAALDAAVEQLFGEIAPPRAELALAVGGSASSLLLLADESLDQPALQRALAAFTAEPAAEAALRLGLHPERARVLPAGIALLSRSSALFGTPLHVVAGGLREGVVLDLLA
jgi:exopolyphosphatase/guanosine-5'-triphosphate,3'-diphosphate pyrophosphatase